MKKVVIAAVLLFFLGQAKAATLFQDNFATADNWADFTPGLSEHVVNGYYTIKDTGTTLGAVFHSANFSTFTYGVTMDAVLPNYSFAGVLFCLGAPSQCSSYIFTIRNDTATQKQYSLTKLDSTCTFETILTGWNSFINPAHNALSVSKSGSRIDLFCNGVWLDSTTDASFDSGFAGLCLGPGEELSFSRVLVTDSAKTGAPPKYFKDSFDNNSLDGWSVWPNAAAAVTCADSMMQIAAGTAQGKTMVYTNGSYRSQPVRAIVKRTNNDSAGYYGLILLKINVTIQNGVPYRGFDAFVFKINAKKNYAAYYYSTSDTTKYTILGPDTHIHGTTDTLAITPDYQFTVNGATLADVNFSTLNFDFNSAGFIVDSSVAVAFDNFAAGDSTQPPPPASLRPVALGHTLRPSFEIGGTGLIYDIRGRLVAKYNGNYRQKVAGLSNGKFFVLPSNGKGYPIQRAIINIR